MIVSCSPNGNITELLFGMSRSAWNNWKQRKLFTDRKWNMVFCLWGMSSHSRVWCHCSIAVARWRTIRSSLGEVPHHSCRWTGLPLTCVLQPSSVTNHFAFLPSLLFWLPPHRLATNLTFLWTAEFLESGCQAGGGRSLRLWEEEIKVLKIIALASTGNSWCVQLVCRSQSGWVATVGWNWREKQQKLSFISSRN